MDPSKGDVTDELSTQEAAQLIVSKRNAGEVGLAKFDDGTLLQLEQKMADRIVGTAQRLVGLDPEVEAVRRQLEQHEDGKVSLRPVVGGG